MNKYDHRSFTIGVWLGQGLRWVFSLAGVHLSTLGVNFLSHSNFTTAVHFRRLLGDRSELSIHGTSMKYMSLEVRSSQPKS